MSTLSPSSVSRLVDACSTLLGDRRSETSIWAVGEILPKDALADDLLDQEHVRVRRRFLSGEDGKGDVLHEVSVLVGQVVRTYVALPEQATGQEDAPYSFHRAKNPLGLAAATSKIEAINLGKLEPEPDASAALLRRLIEKIDRRTKELQASKSA